ncbi:MAG: hypothetical protein GY811_29835 [Myxococcales bacterium]|nr:hypothetical protein [Myxococcales bacterium]
MIRAITATIFAGMLAACGAPAPATSAPAAAQKNEVADGKNLTDFQKKRLLGHYSTYDGKSGFILDRTVDPPKAKLDGAPEVFELTRQGSVTGAYELVNPSTEFWIRIDEESGSVLLFDGPQQNQGVDVTRDADAEQLK